MAESYPSRRHRWLLATSVGVMALGAAVNAASAPTWGGLLQATGLVGTVAVAVRWARGGLRRGERWLAAGAIVLWAIGTSMAAVTVPRLGEILMAGSALGAAILTVRWASSTT